MSNTADHRRQTVLITGCSDGGLGAALAVAYHKAGYQVFATARNTSKMAVLESHGIETLSLDVLSDGSIAACVSEVTKLTGGSLNVLVNNAGAQYNMPISDLSIPESKKIFDLNVWACIAMIQAFIPLLMKAKNGATIVNHTSAGSTIGIPFQSAYNASKAAFAMFSEILRLELEGFDIKVVDLKTGGVKSNIFANLTHGELPPGSIYNVARKEANIVLAGEKLKSQDKLFGDSDVWAENVVSDLTKGQLPHQLWRGGQAWMERFARFATLLPVWVFAGQLKKLTGLDAVTRKIQESRSLEFAEEAKLGMKLA